MEGCPAQASPATVPAALYKERLARARRHNRRAHQCNTVVSQELAADSATVTLECSICLSALHSQPCAFFERNMARTCDHCFHIGCAAQIHWDSNGLGACPLCRAKFDSVRPLPSLIAEPSRWFRCVDIAGEGRLSREQVTKQLLMQFPIEPAKLDVALDAEWPTWDGGRGFLARDDVCTPERGLLAFARAHMGREPTAASHQPAARGSSELQLLVELGADPATAVQLLSRHRSLEAAADAVASSLPSAPARACPSPHATTPSAAPPTSASPPAAPSTAPAPTSAPQRSDEDAPAASRAAVSSQPSPDIRQPVERPGSAAASSLGSHAPTQDGAAPSRRHHAARTAAARTAAAAAATAAAAAAAGPLARAASAVAVVRSVWRGRTQRRASRRSSSLSAGQWA